MKALCVVLLLLDACLTALPKDLPNSERPPLFLREDWKEIPAAKPVTQEHVNNPDLLLVRHGPGEVGIKKSHHDQPADDPWYLWSGEAPGNWAVSLRHKKAWVDLTGQATIRWRTKQAGFRQLRVILKLSDGTWLVSDKFTDQSDEWETSELKIAEIRWRRLDIANITEGKWVTHPDLSKVVEVGCTDLMTGGGSDACSRLDWIEVYGRLVPPRGAVKKLGGRASWRAADSASLPQEARREPRPPDPNRFEFFHSFRD